MVALKHEWDKKRKLQQMKIYQLLIVHITEQLREFRKKKKKEFPEPKSCDKNSERAREMGNY